jgi:hypothetical protein
MLEGQQMYARALEEYRAAYMGASSRGSQDLSRPVIRFSIARLMLTADAENTEGVTELKGAVNEGYDNFDEVEKLLNEERVSAANKTEISAIVTEGRRALEEAKAQAEEAVQE